MLALAVNRHGQATIPIANCGLWSPENPFLYELEARGDADILKTRFGMRSFRLDPATGRDPQRPALFHARQQRMHLRFAEDSEHKDLPWRDDWVRQLHRRFKDMHWNCLRYCIGFPPESWYRIADEEGFLIQDEFPIWIPYPKPGDLDGDELATEYTEWMQERWNHPCVVVWDACNETFSPETGKAIEKVRGLDFSNRPWDNGWERPSTAAIPMSAPLSFLCRPLRLQTDQPFRLEEMPLDPGTKEGPSRSHSRT